MTLTEIIQGACGCKEKVAEKIADRTPTSCFVSLTEGQLRNLGCTPAQARRFVAASRLGTHVHQAHTKYRAMTRTPDDVVSELRKRFDIGALEQENFWAIALDARQRILDVFTIAIGSMSEVSVHPRELFRPLMRMMCHSCILAHNHPSGDASPSAGDVELTRHMVDVARVVGIPVIDHVVVARDSYVSMASLGMVGR